MFPARHQTIHAEQTANSNERTFDRIKKVNAKHYFRSIESDFRTQIAKPWFRLSRRRHDSICLNRHTQLVDPTIPKSNRIARCIENRLKLSLMDVDLAT